MRGLTRWTTTGLILLSLTVAISGFRCAEVVPGWGDNDGEDHGDGGKRLDGSGHLQLRR